MSPGQDSVDRYFDAASEYWDEVYGRGDVQGEVYRRRMATALDWVRALGLGEGARALEVGCGAGLMTAALADLGLRVVATDSSEEMVRRCRSRLERTGAGTQVRVQRADAHDLPFASGEFELVVAIGLLPWLHDPLTAITELGRVLAPGGWLLVTADNRLRLNRLVEPRENPLLEPLKLARRRRRERSGWRPTSAQSFRHAPEEVDAMLRAAGTEPRRRTSVGFGPFTILGRPALPERVGKRLDGLLERRARRGPALRLRGWHYVVAARKEPASTELASR